MTEQSNAPLTIEGFQYERKLGSFPLGDSFQYRELANDRRVHVLLAHRVEPLDTFLAEFRDLLGDQAEGLLLYAGLTDKERPYLVTTFLDDKPDIDDSTRLSARPASSDDTVLSARPASSDDTVLSSRPVSDDLTVMLSRSGKPSAKRSGRAASPRVIASLVVSEREAHVPSPEAPAALPRYAPRTLPATTPPLRLEKGVPTPAVTHAPVSRVERERRRARIALASFAASIAVSVIGAAVLLTLILGR